MKRLSLIEWVLMVLVIATALTSCKTITEPQETELDDTLQCPVPIAAQDPGVSVRYCK